MFTHSCLRGHNEGRCRECVFALISQCVFTGTPTLLPGGVSLRAALLAYGALLHGSTKSWCFSGAGLCAHHVLGYVLAVHLALSQHHHHHTLHQFDVFSGRNLCAHRVLVHQDIRLMPPSDRNHHTSTIIVGFCWGRCEAVHACIRID
ncbi:hypothetical protein PAPYR_9521 [Paratrimastix pyriformis]|uniref:Uncharacterized protein n=1 Tax=Paratrimastix pyriformis TaxID=342808 RepID=A0ABQ8U884_9EUKA|nr:hypothetical protein PAPYR_9521 [Paratrimastix pyriformis]